MKVLRLPHIVFFSILREDHLSNLLTMTRLSLPLLTLSLLLVSCQKDPAFRLQDPATDADGQLARMYLQGFDAQGRSFNYILNGNGASPQTIDIELAFKLSRRAYKVPWRELHEWGQEKLAEHAIAPLRFPQSYSTFLQQLAFETGHRALRKQALDEETARIGQYYLDILLAQKAIDTDALAEMAVYLRPAISGKEFRRYRSYILDVARKNAAEATAKLETYRQQYDETMPTGQNDRDVFRTGVAHEHDQLLAARRAMELLNGPASQN